MLHNYSPKECSWYYQLLPSGWLLATDGGRQAATHFQAQFPILPDNESLSFRRRVAYAHKPCGSIFSIQSAFFWSPSFIFEPSSSRLRTISEPSPNHLRGYKLTLCSAYATPTLRPCLPLAVIQYNYRIYVQKSKNIAPCAPNRVKPFKTKGLSWGIVVKNRAPTAP